MKLDISKFLLAFSLLATASQSGFASTTETANRSLASCDDDSNFAFPYDGQMYSCNDFASDEAKRLILCNQESVRNSCMYTCGSCCADDATFSFNDSEKKRKCAWLTRVNKAQRIAKFCKRNRVQKGCPESCNLCPAPVQNCGNSKTFEYVSGTTKRSCTNIRLEEGRRASLCLKDDVKEACPQTCGVCCVDDFEYTFPLDQVPGGVGSCDWITQNKKNKEKRKDQYCNRFLNGEMVRDRCPNACDFCFDPIVAKTDEPTSSVRFYL